jgi:hypothetical protein
LEELAGRLGIPVRFENVKEGQLMSLGGLCTIKGKRIIIIHAKATKKSKVQTMVKILRTLDLDGVYIRPALRELLER